MMTKTDAYTANMNQTENLNDGVDWLRQKFGDVGTELFISLIIREKFDYTKWQRHHFDDKTPEQISTEATIYVTEHPYTGDPSTII